MRTYDEVWRFETPRFAIIAEVTDCDTDPADQFSDKRDVEMIRNGECAWFDARVRVVLLETGETLGADYLGCCAYKHPTDLFRHHASYVRELRQLRTLQQTSKVKREIAQIRKILRNNAKPVPGVVYCEYGPDMVLNAIADARAHVAKLADLNLRA